jgi:hypothetical protein
MKIIIQTVHFSIRIIAGRGTFVPLWRGWPERPEEVHFPPRLMGEGWPIGRGEVVHFIPLRRGWPERPGEAPEAANRLISHQR